jgi:hypothetical protein
VNRLRRLAIRLLTAVSGNQSNPVSFVRQPQADGSIPDGLDYGLPVVVHGYMADWPADAMQSYLKEAARDTYRFQFDTPMRGSNDMPFIATEDPLREWDAGTREYVISTCHATYHRNPLAKRAVKYMAAFSVGKGFNLVCKNDQIEELLEAFIANPDNAIREYEQQAPIDLEVDGEIMLRLYSGTGESAGQIVAVPMRPWECRWIDTEPGFFRRTISFHFQRMIQRGDDPAGSQHNEIEDVPAEDMIHVPINRHGYELRGRPELYDVLPWLRSYKEWLENRARQNHWRGALLWWVKLIGARPDTVAAKAAQYRQPPTPGSIAVTTDKEEWQALSNPVSAGDAAEDGRQIKLMASVGFGVPEYFLSDGQNSNLASSKSQQLPALTTFEEMQHIMVERLWIPLFKRVIQAQIDAGLLKEELPEMDSNGDETGETIEAIEAFEVSYEPVTEQDPLTLAQAIQIAAGQGWVSDQTATERMGYDWSVEQKRIEDQQEAQQKKQAAGLIPRPPTFRTDGLPTEPGAQDNQQTVNGNQQATNGVKSNGTA